MQYIQTGKSSRIGFTDFPLYFDGVNDWVSIAKSSDFDFGEGDFTIDLWAKHYQDVYIYYFGNNAASSSTPGVVFNSYLFVQYPNNKIAFAFCRGLGDWVSVESPPITDIPDNEIMHIAISRKDSTVHIFINGIKVSTSSYNTDITTGTVDFGVGGCENAHTFYTKLRGGHMRVSKAALFLDDFDPTNIDYSNLSETVLYLPMNEGEGAGVIDMSGKNNHGTLHNFSNPPTKTSGWQNIKND